VEIDHEHTEFRWVAAAGIPKNISPPIIPVIEQFKRVFSPDGGATGDNHPRMDFTLTGPLLGQSGDCEQILRLLPDWFGLEAAIQNYAATIPALPTFLAKAGGQAVGFLSLKQHNPCSAEIYVMGVLPAFHHQGIGRALVEKAEGYAKARQIEYLQVKTLGPSNDDAHYAQTRAFYTAMGFRPLEEFTQIWDENNPCLVMVKKI
jgi:ribosomal protein S18 acetylase RimI-like enzyme